MGNHLPRLRASLDEALAPWKTERPQGAAALELLGRLQLAPGTEPVQRLQDAPAKTPLRLRIDLGERRELPASPTEKRWLKDLPLQGALAFSSDPLAQAQELTGLFRAALRLRVNKRDVDLRLALYAQFPDGRYLELAHQLQRASHAQDRRQRRLLRAGAIESLNLQAERLLGQLLPAGSRIVLLLRVPKQADQQINLGTGGPVSRERASQAGQPLQLELLPGSWIELPVR